MAKMYNLSCFVIIAVFTIVSAEDYCNMKSCNEKGSHTMCKYSSTPAQACGQKYTVDLSDDDKKALLDEHNKLRQKVASGNEERGKPGPQPAAREMPNLTWSTKLEDIAQRWANQCDFNHDKCRNVDEYVVGQNIAKSSSSGENSSSMESFVQMWYEEVAQFNCTKVSKYEFESNTGHYTQLVWAKTTEIGCGLITYKKSDGWTDKYLVCNYGPSGNWIGEKIYETN